MATQLIRDDAKEAFKVKLIELVTYLKENSGLKEEDLPPILNDWINEKISPVEEISLDGGDKLVSVSGAVRTARMVLEEWVQTAPDALDTIQELAQALQNDPDVIQKLFDLIATKASKEDLEKKRLLSNVDFNSVDWDNFFQYTPSGVSNKSSGIYHGIATTDRLGIGATYPDVLSAEMADVLITVSSLHKKDYLVTSEMINLGNIEIIIDHMGVLPNKVLVDGTPADMTGLIDTSQNDRLVITGGLISEGSTITLMFNTYKPLSISKTVSCRIQATVNSVTYERAFMVKDNAFIYDNEVSNNAWYCPTRDITNLGNSLVTAVEEAVASLDDNTPPV